MVDYYNLLGIPADAPPEAVRRAFRARAKAVHPDVHPHVPPGEREALQRRFILLARAYETLSEPSRRAAYDRQRPQPRPTPASGRAGRRGAAAAPAAGTGADRSSEKQRRARPQPAPDGEEAGERLDDLLRDVESLLGRFGLDLRPSFEALLEALLDWAREVFQQVTQAWERDATAGSDGPAAGGPQPSPGGGTRRGAAGRAQASARPVPSAAAGGPRQTAQGFRGAAADVEAELAALRARVRRKGPESEEGPSVEAELRRIKERLGRRP